MFFSPLEDDPGAHNDTSLFSGPDNLDNLKKLAEQFQKQAPGAGAGGATAPEDDDDEVPELVAGQTFEAAAEEKDNKEESQAS